jgi:hypothetical protein
MEEPGAAVQLNVALLVARLMMAAPVVVDQVRRHRALPGKSPGTGHDPVMLAQCMLLLGTLPPAVPASPWQSMAWTRAPGSSALRCYRALPHAGM